MLFDFKDAFWEESRIGTKGLKKYTLMFEKVFTPDFLNSIADLLYPEMEKHPDGLSAEIGETEKKREDGDRIGSK